MKKKYEKPDVLLSMNGTLEGVFACGDEDSNNGHHDHDNHNNKKDKGWDWWNGWH